MLMNELETMKKVVKNKEHSQEEEGIQKQEEIVEVEYEVGRVAEIRDICGAARKVIGLTPIEPRMLEIQMRSYGAKTKEEAMLMEVKNYLKCEM